LRHAADYESHGRRFDKFFLVPVRASIVSFNKHEGIRHSVDGHAATLYEAAALPFRAFPGAP
jgi:hypothetical protein